MVPVVLFPNPHTSNINLMFLFLLLEDSRVSIVEWSDDTDGSNMYMPSKFDSWNQRYFGKNTWL